jgi:hypothetical protein
MRKPGDYQERAAQCLRLAQSTSDSTNKALLLEMAQTWVRLAEQAREAFGQRLLAGRFSQIFGSLPINEAANVHAFPAFRESLLRS